MQRLPRRLRAVPHHRDGEPVIDELAVALHELGGIERVPAAGPGPHAVRVDLGTVTGLVLGDGVAGPLQGAAVAGLGGLPHERLGVEGGAPGDHDLGDDVVVVVAVGEALLQVGVGPSEGGGPEAGHGAGGAVLGVVQLDRRPAAALGPLGSGDAGEDAQLDPGLAFRGHVQRPVQRGGGQCSRGGLELLPVKGQDVGLTTPCRLDGGGPSRSSKPLSSGLTGACALAADAAGS